MRVLIGLAAATVVASLSSCSGSPGSANQSVSPRTATAASSAPATKSVTTPAPRSSTPPLRLDPRSPALARFNRSQVLAALDIAARAGRESVSDPDLLGRTGLHDNISDFARITRYLTPSATAYLTLYCRDAYRNQANRARVAGLALVAYKSGQSTTEATRGTFINPPPFDQPFKVQRFTLRIDPTVRVNAKGRMVVTGAATAQIFATQTHVTYVDTLTERFTYYIAGAASAASVVGIDGWYGYPNVTWKRR